MGIDVTVVEIPAPGSAYSLDDHPDVAAARRALDGHTVWHVNATAQGGGVAELLSTTMRHHRASGIDARWLVPSGHRSFFEITKQLHHLLHGSRRPGIVLGDDESALYHSATALHAEAALSHMTPGDLVVLHDPQTLGMGPTLARAGMAVVWRSHIGTDSWSDNVAAAWAFLAPFLHAPRRYVFSSPRYAPPSLDAARVDVIHPSIDPHSPKCAEMDDVTVHRVLGAVGLERGAEPVPDAAGDQLARLAPHARVVQDDALPAGAPMVLQLCRWDPLKDMAGVLNAFALGIASSTEAHLVLAGPDPDDIPDDPENASVMGDLLAVRAALPGPVRRRTHLAVLSLTDLEANTTIVNALQRRATVVSQKSLQEGFGLTVTEAMWKRRPVVAAAVGGIREQIEHRRHGLLIDDPADLVSYANAVIELLEDRPLRDGLAEAARARCVERFLSDREMADYSRLYVQALANP